MTIPSFKILKRNASQRLAASENAGKVVLIYAGVITALAALVTLVNYALNLQIAQTGGLSNMGLRSLLSTVQSVLPMVQSMIAMCLEIGYLAAMLRIAREQFVSHQTLRLGFDRFWVMLRCTLIRSGIFMLAALAAIWVSTQIYMITPLSAPLVELLTPIVESAGSASMAELQETLLLDTTLTDRMMSAMLPLMGIFGVLYAILVIPISYSLRLANYVIIDKPGQGAVFALKESRKMMRGSRMRLFRLDLSLWWWYAIAFLSQLLCYADVLLPQLGVTLPMSADAAYFLFYFLFLMAQFAACILLRNRVEVVYAQVYNALKPREQNNGVVLGNIFQM